MNKDTYAAEPTHLFSVTDESNSRVVAVIEATDPLAAQQRFERIRATVQFIERISCAVYSVEEKSRDEPIRCAAFFDGYFCALDAAESQQH